MKTRNNYTTRSFDVNHNTFGGTIEQEDFNTYCPNKNRINNQISDEQFQKSLIEKNKQRKDFERYKNMTLEELKEMRLVSNTNGRPSSTLTDEKWQRELSIRKMFITPFDKNVKKFGGKHSKESGYWNDETQGTYHGCTNWQQYCSYINDILNNIRAGQIDYCYYIYQIMDLAKFHYEELKTRYCDGYWEVWLER